MHPQRIANGCAKSPIVVIALSADGANPVITAVSGIQ
jgi:hypothetical protein